MGISCGEHSFFPPMKYGRGMALKAEDQRYLKAL